MKCPCENCILIPICKGKSYCNLLACGLLQNYIIDWESKYEETDRGFRNNIFSCVDPCVWHIDNLNRIVDVSIFESGTPVIID